MHIWQLAKHVTQRCCCRKHGKNSAGMSERTREYTIQGASAFSHKQTYKKECNVVGYLKCISEIYLYTLRSNNTLINHAYFARDIQLYAEKDYKMIFGRDIEY